MLCRVVLLLFCAICAFPQTLPFTVDDALDVRNVNITDLSDDGKWLVVTQSSARQRIGVDNHRFGDPTYVPPALQDLLVIETATGKTSSVFPRPRNIRAARFSPDGSVLAVIAQEADQPGLYLWDRPTGTLSSVLLPDGKVLAGNGPFLWSNSGKELITGLRPAAWFSETRAMFARETQGPVIVYNGKDPFLNWDNLRRQANRMSLNALEVAGRRWRELAADGFKGTMNITKDDASVVWYDDIAKKTNYDAFGSEHAIKVQPFAGAGDARTIIPSTTGITPMFSENGRVYVYAKNGDIYYGTIDDKEARQITGKKPDPQQASPAVAGDADSEKQKERWTPVRLSPTGDKLVVSNKEGIWLMTLPGAERELFHKASEDDKTAPRYTAVAWSPDGGSIYFTYASRTAWERGLYRYDLASKSMRELTKGASRYTGWRLSKDGSTWVYAMADGVRPAEIYVAGADLRSPRKLTNSNPQLASRRLPRSELVSYLDADGKKLFGVLYYPVDYKPGTKYPTIFHIYEQFFDDGFNPYFCQLTNHGYAVFEPSVEFETGFPGEAWLKGVTSAANKLIDMGVADPDKLGVQGTSYGGYAANLLITQTSRFKAAVNVSGKVNMISFYTDSPRLGIRNIHAPEKSQDRIGATLWQQPQKYLAHSAILYADRIKTPLLLITGEEDHNVPARQAMEMYYALRRLGKTVTWVNYRNGGHGTPTNSLDDYKDYFSRLLAWYEEHLKSPRKAEPAKATPSGAGE